MITNEMKLNWLLETAEAIERDQLTAGFDMNIFYRGPAACPTAACLGGHYVILHPGCGLRLQGDLPLITDGGPGRYSMDILIAHFGFMKEQDAIALFDPGTYDRRGRPDEVVARVRATVAHYQEKTDE